jgi:hypothetical protein
MDRINLVYNIGLCRSNKHDKEFTSSMNTWKLFAV